MIQDVLRESSGVTLTVEEFYQIFEKYFESPSHAAILEFQSLSEKDRRGFVGNLMGGVEKAINKGELQLYPLHKMAVKSLFRRASSKILNGYRIVWKKSEYMKQEQVESALSRNIEKMIRDIVRDELKRVR